MRSTLRSCVLEGCAEQTVWRLTAEEGGARLTMKPHGGREETVHQEESALLNLEAFFSTCSPAGWAALPACAGAGARITLEYAESVYTVNAEQLPGDPLFADLARFFTACFTGAYQAASLSFYSFEGGGPIFSAEMESKGVATWSCARHYFDKNHDQLCGAGYEVIYTFYPLRPGVTSARITANSLIAPEPPRRVWIEVNDALRLNLTITEVSSFE